MARWRRTIYWPRPLEVLLPQSRAPSSAGRWRRGRWRTPPAGWRGPHRVTRVRWLLVKLLVFVPLLAGAAVVGILEVVLLNLQGPQTNRWAVFDQQAPLTV